LRVQANVYRVFKFMQLAMPSGPQRSASVCAVFRHAERSDNGWDGIWAQTLEAQSWPHDPPLSNYGLEDASRAAAELVGSIEPGYAKFQVVVSSPYFRCVQTAVAMCQAVGPGVVLLLDAELGEIYGPDVMGDEEPARRTRPIEHIRRYCKSCGVILRLSPEEKMLGKLPTWPENLGRARARFVGRFLRYLKRSNQSKRSFVLVTHADGVAAALSTMPCMNSRAVSKVENAGFFIAHANLPKTPSSLLHWGSGISCGDESCESPSSTCDSNIDLVADKGPLLAPGNGWSVKCSGLALGEGVGEDFWASIQRWSRKTVFSELDIAKLLHCLPDRTLSDDGRQSTTLGRSAIASKSAATYEDAWARQTSSTSTTLFSQTPNSPRSPNTPHSELEKQWSSSQPLCPAPSTLQIQNSVAKYQSAPAVMGSILSSVLMERRRKSCGNIPAIAPASTASQRKNGVFSVVSL